jgi:hypothetical protein
MAPGHRNCLSIALVPESRGERRRERHGRPFGCDPRPTGNESHRERGSHVDKARSLHLLISSAVASRKKRAVRLQYIDNSGMADIAGSSDAVNRSMTD